MYVLYIGMESTTLNDLEDDLTLLDKNGVDLCEDSKLELWIGR